MLGESENIKSKMHSLMQQLSYLQEIILVQQPQTVGFRVSSVTLEQEAELLNHDVRQLTVTKLENEPNKVVNFWREFYKADGYSTKFVDRMPGLVVVEESKDEVRAIVNLINDLKAEIAALIRGETLVQGKVTHRRTTAEKHEYIHQLFPRIMTEHVYRNVHIIERPVTHAWFNWVSRPVPKKLKVQEARDYLYNQINRPQIGFIASEWNELIEQSLLLLQMETLKYVQIQKQFKVFPTMPFKFISEEGELKRNTKNAITPFILLGQPDGKLPQFTDLTSYDSKQLEQRKPKLSKNKMIIHDELGLVGVK